MSNPRRPLRSVLAEPDEAGPSPVVTLLADPGARPVWPSAAAFVATCTDARHPCLLGRVKVACDLHPGPANGAGTGQWWVPTLRGLSIREGDRLLLQHVVGSSEPVVIGVIDGFSPRAPLLRHHGPRLELKADESLMVHTEDGQGLVEITPSAKGHVVRLLQSDTHLEVCGKLSISAQELELRSSGSVHVEAADDVRLVGELVKLN